MVGPERATAHAIASVDAATLAAARDRLQLWSLSGASRTALEGAAGVARRPQGPARAFVNVAAITIAAGGTAVLAASVVAARGPAIPVWEQGLFRRINRLPGWLFVPLWPAMQLGNLAVGAAAGLAVAWGAGDLAVALAVLFATALKLVAERLIRRRSPATSRPVSGPAPANPTRSCGVATSPRAGPASPPVTRCSSPPWPAWWHRSCPTGWELVPVVLMFLVMVGRVFVGAHNPLDVISGAGAGLMVGGLVASLLPPT